MEAVVANIEAVLRLKDAAMRQRARADMLADGIANFTGTIRQVAVHLTWFGVWARLKGSA